MNGSRIRWYPIPVGLGVGFLGLVQVYKVYSREQEQKVENARPKRRRVRPDGPWYVLAYCLAVGSVWMCC